MEWIFSILILIGGYGLIFFLFTLLPTILMNRFRNRVGKIKYGMTREEVKELLKIKPAHSTYKYDYYIKTGSTSNTDGVKVTTTNMIIAFKLTYDSNQLISLEKMWLNPSNPWEDFRRNYMYKDPF